jgi:DNA-directed RNA polymerase specialized sigma24 family protein
MATICEYHDWAVFPDLSCEECLGSIRAYARQVARQLARCPADADDVASDAIVELLARRKFDPRRASFKTYLKLLLQHAADSFYGRAGRVSRNLAAVGPFVIQISRRNRGTVAQDVKIDLSIREADLRLALTEVLSPYETWDRRAFYLLIAGHSLAEISNLVSVHGRHVTAQRWGQRLQPIQNLVQGMVVDLSEDAPHLPPCA